MSMEREMSSAPRRRNKIVEKQEELIWDRFYPQARRDATLAMEILNELERDESLRRRHLGLCLSCQRCIRLHERREARNRRVGRVVRAAFAALFIAAPQAVLRGARHSGQLLLACMPGGDNEADDETDDESDLHLLNAPRFEALDPALRKRARQAADRQAASSNDEALSQRTRPNEETVGS